MACFDERLMDEMDYLTFMKIISNIPSCIFFKDAELKYRFSTHCWAQLNSDDIVGKTDLDVRKDRENAIKAMEADREILRTKKGCSYVIKSEIDGDVSFLELIKEPLLDNDGEAIGIVGLINDVTDKTIMEYQIREMSSELETKCQQLENSNAELKETLHKVEQLLATSKLFTASMNHELRSPLNAILGSLQVLMDDETIGAEQKENIANAFESSQLMLHIVNELLDFAKLEINGFKIKKERFDLKSILKNVAYLTNNQAKEKGLTFSLVVQENLPTWYVGDDTRIKQIMNNFLSNALKYTDKGSITLQVAYSEGELVITCSDTGQGISEESKKTLFDPYVRCNENKNASIQGTGLGLSIVKRIIDNMKGEIFVDSSVNEGSTFTAIIPIEIYAEDYQNRNLPEDEKPFQNKKALCVDDAKINLAVFSSLLNSIGMNADKAVSAAEAIEMAQENEYDIIFMDHMMPEMDGLEAFHYIRENSTKNSKTPIAMLTGNADSSYAKLYEEEGLDGYLTKPVTKAILLDVLKKLLK